jgi:hypothetical protein
MKQKQSFSSPYETHVESAGLQPKSLIFFYVVDRRNVKSNAFLFGHTNHQMNDLDA